VDSEISSQASSIETNRKKLQELKDSLKKVTDELESKEKLKVEKDKLALEKNSKKFGLEKRSKELADLKSIEEVIQKSLEDIHNGYSTISEHMIKFQHVLGEIERPNHDKETDQKKVQEIIEKIRQKQLEIKKGT